MESFVPFSFLFLRYFNHSNEKTSPQSPRKIVKRRNAPCKDSKESLMLPSFTLGEEFLLNEGCP